VTAPHSIPGAGELGLLGIVHVRRFWARCLAKRAGHHVDDVPEDWVADNTLLSGLGLNLLETYRYLYGEAPTLEQFEHWILKKNGGSMDRARMDRLNAALRGDGNSDAHKLVDRHNGPLTADDLAFWDDNGYVVVHEAVSPENRDVAARAIYEFLGADPNCADSWYGLAHGHSIWVPVLHHPALWANRNSARIHQAFAQLWGRTDLWPTVDQGGFNPPERPGWRFPGPFLHWDASIAWPMPFGVQGILYLTDTAANQGAFTCVPSFHRKIHEWLEALPPGADPRRQDLSSLGAIPIAGKAGDLIIWHHALPHGSSPNSATRPRVVQYIALRPAQWEHNSVWK
jgi:hypothetical protein